MAQMINLRSARKNRMRAQKQTEADANRQRHGRTKAQKELERAHADKAERALDGHRLAAQPTSDEPTT